MDLQEKFILSRWCYSVGESFITDAEYTHLLNLFETNGELPEYTSRSWSSDPCPYDLLKKYNMEDKAHHIIHTDKTESMPSLTEESRVREVYWEMRDLHYVSFKEDGWSLKLTYFNKGFTFVQTRGRKNDSIDVSHLKTMFPSEVGMEGRVEVVGELTLTHENFQKLKQMFPSKDLVSQRAAVRTAIANQSAWHLLTFHAFDIFAEDKEFTAGYTFFLLDKWGFETPFYKVVTNYEQLMHAIRELNDAKSVYPLLTDGIVVRSDIGRTLRAIRILNWQEPIYKSYVIGYEEGTAAHSFPMSLLIHPIRLENSTQSQIPITNVGRIVDNKLIKGSPVAFKFTSASIADLDADVTAILQQTYKDNYEAFQRLIEREEYIKEENRNR